MVKLNYLHEPGVLNNLQSRYGLDEIYTYTGSILIAVSPRQIPAPEPFHHIPPCRT